MLKRYLSFFSALLLSFVSLFSFFSFFFSFSLYPQEDLKDTSSLRKISKVLVLDISSTINPATFEYLSQNIKRLKLEKNQGKDSLVLIKLNTPGGLVSSTKNIITLFGEQDFPIVIWITPSGASATSAGAIIASAAELIFMSEGTNIGAATPVELGGDIEESDLRNKAINDLVALVEGLSLAHKRSASHFAQMVREGKSFSAGEAQKLGLINGIATTEEELFSIMNSQSVNIKGKHYTIQIQNPQMILAPMSFTESLLDIFSNPSFAYILFVLGAILLYLELQAPGGFIAGSIGVVCLILAAIAFQLLPLNFGALGLIVLSFVLFILEFYIVSYGALSLVALASLFCGSLFLFETEDSYMDISLPIIFSTSAALVLFIGIIAFIVGKDLLNKTRKKNYYSFVKMQGIISEVGEKDNLGNFHYKVKIHGEIWSALSMKEYKLSDTVIIEKQDANMKLYF